MNILYVSGTYCPSVGGAEISAHSLLKRLQKDHGIEVRVLTDERYTEGKGQSVFEGVKLIGTTHEKRARAIEEALEEYAPDHLITQLLWSDIALRIAKERQTKSILRICKIPFDLDISERSPYAPHRIMVVSDPVREYVRTKWQRDATVFNSIVEVDRAVQGKDMFSNEYILMFNNLVRKGAGTFAKMAELLPEQRFAIVPGWDMLKKDGAFDDEIIKNMCASLGMEYKGQRPEIVTDFPENVDILTPKYDVRQIYARTRVLCVPSIWQETFGRVATEGMMSNIPVIGSAVGGLKDIVSKGGIVIGKYEDPAAWAYEVRQLLDRESYDTCVTRGRDYIEKEYDTSRIINDFARWIDYD